MNNRSYICRVAAQDPPKPQFAPLVPEGPPMLLSPSTCTKIGTRETRASGRCLAFRLGPYVGPDDIAGYTGTLPNPKMEPVGVIKELLKGLSKVDEVCAPHPGSNAANCVTAEKCVSVQPQLLRLRPPRSDPRCLHDGFSQCKTTGSSRFSPTQPSRCRSHSCRSKSSVQLWTRARTAFSSTDTKRTRSCSQHSGITSSTQWMMQLSHVRLPFLKWHAVANRSEVIPQTQFEEGRQGDLDRGHQTLCIPG